MPYNKHLREIVEKLLKDNKRCRTDTKWLTYWVMRHYTKIFIPYNDFKKIPSFESIARCKRDIMNKEGKFNGDFMPEEGVSYEKPIGAEHEKYEKQKLEISEETKKVLEQARRPEFTEQEIDDAQGYIEN